MTSYIMRQLSHIDVYIYIYSSPCTSTVPRTHFIGFTTPFGEPTESLNRSTNTDVPTMRWHTLYSVQYYFSILTLHHTIHKFILLSVQNENKNNTVYRANFWKFTIFLQIFKKKSNIVQIFMIFFKIWIGNAL